MRVLLTLAVAAACLPSPVLAQRAGSPADATVFIRLVGSAHIELINGVLTQSADEDHVEIGTGSGFVVSPYGYVLTNDHVVNTSEPYVITNGVQKATLTFTVSRIDVCLPPATAAGRGLQSACVAGSVVASDPSLDLAVVLIGGSNHPYVGLGDSDAVTAGLPVDALGYPFGRNLDLGRLGTAAELTPEVTTTPGAISAVRADEQGEQRYLQITNSLNPGNSGGPLVTRDGFAVGLICMTLARAAGIGFAIPINTVKEFLTLRGIDQLLPVRRLELGGLQAVTGKGMGLRLPMGLADVSPFRTRVEGKGNPPEIELRIDRVATLWSPKRIEETLVGTQQFELLAMTTRQGRIAPRPGNPPMLLGAAEGSAPGSNQEMRMDFAILDLGSEKLVARYVGSAEWMAFNEHVVRESLTSLQAERLLAGLAVGVEKLEWPPAPEGPERDLPSPPAGWIVEPGAPVPCPGLPRPGAATAASPSADFTVALRAAVWRTGDLSPDAAAAACSSQRGALGAASYAIRAEWLGVSYVIEGVFVRTSPDRVVRLEVSSTEQARAVARSLLIAWARRTTGS